MHRTTVYATGLERISEFKTEKNREMVLQTQKETKPTPDDAVQGLMMTAFASTNAREALGVA